MGKNGRSKKSSIRYLLVLYITLVVISVPLLMIYFPSLKNSFNEYRVLEHYKLWRSSEEEKERKEVLVFLKGISGYQQIVRVINPGLRDPLHYTLEALLLPLSVEEKEAGLYSEIMEGVTLKGATIQDDIAFVTLSPSFLLSDDLDEAGEEIDKTLSINLGTQGLVVIVDGSIVLRK